MHKVFLCLIACFLIESNKFSISPNKILPDCFNCKLKHVSNTSDEVIPLCRNLASLPAFSVIEVKKAITSCFTLSSIFKILETLIFAFDLTFFTTPFGIIFSFSIASAAASSISSHILYLFSSDQIVFSSCLEYLSIIQNKEVGLILV